MKGLTSIHALWIISQTGLSSQSMSGLRSECITILKETYQTSDKRRYHTIVEGFLSIAAEKKTTNSIRVSAEDMLYHWMVWALPWTLERHCCGASAFQTCVWGSDLLTLCKNLAPALCPLVFAFCSMRPLSHTHWGTCVVCPKVIGIWCKQHIV